MADPRTDHLATNLATVNQRLQDACEAAGRARADVALVAITKTFPADDVRRLASLGVREVGENRDQEAAPKAAELRDVDVRWHFVGQLQTNKCRSVASYADVVHSVDRPQLVEALARAAESADRHLEVFIQVSLDEDPTRGGAAPSSVAALADQIAQRLALRVVGVMAIAPFGADATAAFTRLAEVSAQLRRAHPEAIAISAGMSGDLEAAIGCGATHVRIGTALLGGRPPHVR